MITARYPPDIEDAIAKCEAYGCSVVRPRNPEETLMLDWEHLLKALRMIHDRVLDGTPLHVRRYTKGDPRHLVCNSVTHMVQDILQTAVIDEPEQIFQTAANPSPTLAIRTT